MSSGECGREGLLFGGKRLSSQLYSEVLSALALDGNCVGDCLTKGIPVMRKAHACRQFCSVLAAIRKDDQLAGFALPCSGDIAENSVGENLGDFLKSSSQGAYW